MTKIDIYTTPFCPFCHRAKALLKHKGAAFNDIDVMMSPAKRREMGERAGGRTSVPQIFVDGEHIGDCTDIHEMESAGTLDAALKIVPAA
ncbi:MAG: glutaredoxin 3 [Rhodospirillales bacterium]|nr:glutaredoxin 3 [Rhodospirillales bacterium]